MKTIGSFLVALALIAGMVACGDITDNGNGEVSYQLSVSSTSGGSVVEPGEGVYTYPEATIVNLAATPDAGHVFVNWTGDTGTVADVNAASTTITMNGDYPVTANFDETPPVRYQLTISSTTGGSVTTLGEGTFSYDAGTVVELVAEAEEGYRFTSWDGDVESIADVGAPSTMVTINGDYSIKAHFVEVTEIWDWYDLDAVRDDLSGNYMLMNDLDSATAGYTELASLTANGGKGWEPIGDAFQDGQNWVGEFFVGTFYGEGYEIRGLFIRRPLEHPQEWVKPVGLFGSVGSEGIIEAVGVTDANVTSIDCVGGLVGWNDGTVSNSYSTGIIHSEENNVGGLVGLNSGVVTNSYSLASVSGEVFVGGLVGQHWGTVSNSHFTGSVSGEVGVGGLVGTGGGTVLNSYYNYHGVPINGENVITIGALYEDDFDVWLANGKSIDVNGRLRQEGGYYLIDSVSDLRELLALGQDGSLRFRLTDDLDLADAPNLYIPYLAGEFHGDGHTVFNLTLQLAAISSIGFFGYVANSGRIYHLRIEDMSVSGSFYIGGLVGGNYGTIGNSYSKGHVYGRSAVGGLVGWNHGGTVGNSYSTASATGQVNIGGLIGRNLGGTVSNTYSTGIVRGDTTVGGLIGVNEGTVINSYSVGSVTGYQAGGLVGIDTYWGTGVAYHSFWDTQTSGRATSAGGIGRTTAQMKSLTTFSTATWDIATVALGETNPTRIWNIVDGQTYPFLSWQSVP